MKKELLVLYTQLVHEYLLHKAFYERFPPTDFMYWLGMEQSFNISRTVIKQQYIQLTGEQFPESLDADLGV